MSATDIRRRNRKNTTINNVVGINVGGSAPTDNQSPVYDPTSQTLRPTDVIPFNGDVSISANKIFADGIRFGAQGTVIRELRFQRVTVTGIPSQGLSPPVAIAFNPPFDTTIPRVFASIQTGSSVRRINVVIRNLTVNGFDLLVSNSLSGTIASVGVNLLIIST